MLVTSDKLTELRDPIGLGMAASDLETVKNCGDPRERVQRHV